MGRLKNEYIRQGETLSLLVQDVETTPTLVSATIIVKQSVTSANSTISKTAYSVNGVADLTLSATDTYIPVGDYVYQITLQDSNGIVTKLPDADDCDDCDGVDESQEGNFPTLTIWPALDGSIS